MKKRKWKLTWLRALMDTIDEIRRTGQIDLWKLSMSMELSRNRKSQSRRSHLQSLSPKWKRTTRMMRSRFLKDGLRQMKSSMKRQRRRRKSERRLLQSFFVKERKMKERWRLSRSSWQDRKKKEDMPAKNGTHQLLKDRIQRNNSLLIKFTLSPRLSLLHLPHLGTLVQASCLAVWRTLDLTPFKHSHIHFSDSQWSHPRVPSSSLQS